MTPPYDKRVSPRDLRLEPKVALAFYSVFDLTLWCCIVCPQAMGPSGLN